MPTPIKKIAVIAGAGPAGLTAALELLRRSNITPLVFDVDRQVGGISKTVEHNGNRMDLGGHRFFSKSDWVMKWWQEILPVSLDDEDRAALTISYRGDSRILKPLNLHPATPEKVMLVRRRLSRILYRSRYFDYPLTLSISTLRNLGMSEALMIAASYVWAKLFPRHPESSLEDFFINRFGRRLYRTFFKGYTEKVWGVQCKAISAEWGAQRIRGLSMLKALKHAASSLFGRSGKSENTRVETSLIESFLYPKLGPGQMWEEVARRITSEGGGVQLNHRVTGIERDGNKIVGVRVLDVVAGESRLIACDYFLSTIPICELIEFLRPENPTIEVIARNLPYRDFITAGILVKQMKNGPMPPDNWIYIQDPDVKLGRLQIFNNWSPYMVADAGTIWLGLEYFCQAGDELWTMTNEKFLRYAALELEKLGFIDPEDVLDGKVVRVLKAYPAYFGSYAQFGELRHYLDKFVNLFPIGRNGMHKYNNQDHSMLTAKAAIDSITLGQTKTTIWEINTEDDYHEDAVADESADSVAAHS